MSSVQDIVADLGELWDIDWFDYQEVAFDGEATRPFDSARTCLFFRTGAGKTFTSLALMQIYLRHANPWDCDGIVVVAPPRTHAQWQELADKAELSITTMSHAKYRMASTKLSRNSPLIVDEFHLLGGQRGQGWIKLDRQARGMKAPLIILSATPNYNDAERVYCVQHVLDPNAVKGGYVAWLYQNCETKPSNFSIMPEVVGFKDQRPARDHLAELSHVYYVEDPHLDFPIDEVEVSVSHHFPPELEKYGLDRRRGRIFASAMEERQARKRYLYLTEQELLRPEVYETIAELAGQVPGQTLVFCARSKIAAGAHEWARQQGARSGIITGDQTDKFNDGQMSAFLRGELDVLFGTATMGTGVDGLDKICDLLILLDDTDDAALRRQVMGRILPRGADSDASSKRIIRVVPI